MRYSFDMWKQHPETPAQEPQPFADDLKELEASLSMTEEDWQPTSPEAPPPETYYETYAESERPPDHEWDALAEVVAAHVLAYVQNAGSPSNEAQRWQRLAEEYYEDNRVMAAQIRDLLAEKELMTRRLAGFELELARYRPLVGNLYLRW